MAGRLVFPDGFLWGAATASYQIEGAYTEGGKGQSIWDKFAHTPGKIVNGDTGDIACDHYHRYAQDVDLMGDIGLQAYRFSISWPRIFPEGRGKVNRAGLEFYERLVDSLLAADIRPFITLYHWDLPQALQELGGWANRDVAHWFRDYAATVYEVLGDRVKDWITHNEPWVTAVIGHLWGVHAPGIQDLPTAVTVAHNLMLSHGEAVLAMRDIESAGLNVGVTLNFAPSYPASESDEDALAATKADAFANRWFLDPIFEGSYPDDLLEMFIEAGGEDAVAGIVSDDLPVIAQPIDFLGVNYYTRQIVRRDPKSELGYARVRNDGAPHTEMDWEVYPQGLYDLLTRLHRDYAPVMHITENGCAYVDKVGALRRVRDESRTAYLRAHFRAAHRAIQDGVDLRGYFVWSLMDNFEWALGYSRRFGIVYVDYETLERISKDSARWYHDVIGENGPEGE